MIAEKILNQSAQLVDIAAVRSHPDNPRVGNIEVIRKSIRLNGFYGFLIVQASTGFILAGNHRFLAAIAEGYAKIPVVYVDVDDQLARQILLADNHTSDLGGYDEAKLAELLSGLAAAGALEGSTYTEEDVQALVASVEEAAAAAAATAEGKTDDDDIPEPGPDPVTETGDVWILGAHRLLCGDSTAKADMARLMGVDQRADMVFTDPPYNVDYDAEDRGDAPSEKRKANPLGKIKNDAMGPEQFRAFLDAVYSAIDSVLNPGRALYICHADTQGHHFRNAFIAQPWKMQACLIWRKSQLVMGRADYHWIHEPILYGWKEGASHLWAGDRKQTTVWDVSTDHADKKNSDTDGYVHPTQKPVALMVRAVTNSSRAGDAVLDPFGGSGSTLIACEKLGRSARLMELDPKFCDVIVKRWQNFTGKAAVHESGLTFDEMLTARRSAVA